LQLAKIFDFRQLELSCHRKVRKNYLRLQIIYLLFGESVV